MWEVYSQLGTALYREGCEMRLLASCVSCLSGQGVGCPPGESWPSPSILRMKQVDLHCSGLQFACGCILARALSSARVFLVSCSRKLLRSATVPSSRCSIRCTRARRASCPLSFSCRHARQLSETSDSGRRRLEETANRRFVHLDGRERPPATSYGSIRGALASDFHDGEIRPGSIR